VATKHKAVASCCFHHSLSSLGYILTDVVLWRNSVNFVRCGVQIDLIPHEYDTHRIVGYVYLKT